LNFECSARTTEKVYVLGFEIYEANTRSYKKCRGYLEAIPETRRPVPTSLHLWTWLRYGYHFWTGQITTNGTDDNKNISKVILATHILKTFSFLLHWRWGLKH